jgi:hypothetical protein
MTDGIPDDALLTRNAAAAALTEAGYPTSPATLATKATRGGGPPFRRYGSRPLYKWGDALRWAQSRLGPLICNTSQPSATQTNIAATPRRRGRLHRQSPAAREAAAIT